MPYLFICTATASSTFAKMYTAACLQARHRYAEIFDVVLYMAATLHRALENMTRKHDQLLHGWNGLLDELAAARTAAKKEAAGKAAAEAECTQAQEAYQEYRDHAEEEISLLQQSNAVRDAVLHVHACLLFGCL